MKDSILRAILTISLLCIAGNNVLAQGGKLRDRSEGRVTSKLVKPNALQQHDRLVKRDQDVDRDFDRIHDRERDRYIDVQFEPDEDSVGGKIYAHHLMNMTERNAYRKSLREAGSDQQRKSLRKKHRQEMQERAKTRQIKIAK